jgi:hypothetical protein
VVLLLNKNRNHIESQVFSPNLPVGDVALSSEEHLYCSKQLTVTARHGTVQKENDAKKMMNY